MLRQPISIVVLDDEPSAQSKIESVLREAQSVSGEFKANVRIYASLSDFERKRNNSDLFRVDLFLINLDYTASGGERLEGLEHVVPRLLTLRQIDEALQSTRVVLYSKNSDPGAKSDLDELRRRAILSGAEDLWPISRVRKNNDLAADILSILRRPAQPVPVRPEQQLRRGAEPTHFHGILLFALRASTLRLESTDRLTGQVHDTSSRFKATVFLICEEMRARGLIDGPLPAQFLDWSSHPALEFFRCTMLDRSINWMADKGWVGSRRRRSSGIRLLDRGEDALDWMVHSSRQTELHPDGFPSITNHIVQNCVDETIRKVADLKTELLREHLLNYSIRLFNEPPAFPQLDFDRRYDVEDYTSERKTLSGFSEYTF